MARNVTKTIICMGASSPRLDCGEKPVNSFFDTFNPYARDGKVAYCENCVNKIVRDLQKKGFNNKAVLYYTLAKLDIPFMSEIYNSLTARNANISVASYIKNLNKRTDKKDEWTDFSCTDIKVSEVDGTQELQDALNKNEERVKTWGVQKLKADYDFLEETYERYTRDLGELTPNQEDLYRDLARDRLLLRKIADNRTDSANAESIDTIQKRIERIGNTLKINDFESKKKTLSEQMIFNKIQQVELTEPSELYGEKKSKYKDYFKFSKYLKDLVLRPLGNMLCNQKDFDININDINEYVLEENTDDSDS